MDWSQQLALPMLEVQYSFTKSFTALEPPRESDHYCPELKLIEIGFHVVYRRGADH